MPFRHGPYHPDARPLNHRLVSHSQTLAGRRVWSTAHIRLVPQLGWATSSCAPQSLHNLLRDNCSVSSVSEASLTRRYYSSKIYTLWPQRHLSPTPVGVGVGTSLIWAVDQTLLPARVWLRETNHRRDRNLYCLWATCR